MNHSSFRILKRSKLQKCKIIFNSNWYDWMLFFSDVAIESLLEALWNWIVGMFHFNENKNLGISLCRKVQVIFSIYYVYKDDLGISMIEKKWILKITSMIIQIKITYIKVILPSIVWVLMIWKYLRALNWLRTVRSIFICLIITLMRKKKSAQKLKLGALSNIFQKNEV